MSEPISGTAFSCVAAAATGTFCGIDPFAIFGALMGALTWRGIQPSIAITFDEVYRAFAWGITSMMLGTFGGMIAATVVPLKFVFLQGAPKLALVILLAFLVSLAANPIIDWLLLQLKEWRLNK
jgi:hypothetical protein